MLFSAGSADVFFGTSPHGKSTLTVSKGGDPAADFKQWFQEFARSVQKTDLQIRGVQMGQYPAGGKPLFQHVHHPGDAPDAVLALVAGALQRDELDTVFASKGMLASEFGALYFNK